MIKQLKGHIEFRIDSMNTTILHLHQLNLNGEFCNIIKLLETKVDELNWMLDACQELINEQEQDNAT
jgi:hypothetical protein